MKAKALIALLSAGAIITTAGISYATWDTLSATKETVALTVAEATTVSIQSEDLTFSGALAPEGAVSGAPAEATFTVNVAGAANKLDLGLEATNIKITDADGSNPSAAPAGDIVVTFVEKTGETETEVDNGEHKDKDVNPTNTYTVKVAFKDNNAAINSSKVTSYSGKRITFDISASASAKTSTPA